MLLRIGLSRQQYRQLESEGNPRLDTLALIAKGLNSELMLIPNEKPNAVSAVLKNENVSIELVKGYRDSNNYLGSTA